MAQVWYQLHRPDNLRDEMLLSWILWIKLLSVSSCGIGCRATAKRIGRLPQAISRARRVCLEIALCNDWKWFATFTIAKDNYDRKNLEGYYDKFSEVFLCK